MIGLNVPGARVWLSKSANSESQALSQLGARRGGSRQRASSSSASIPAIPMRSRRKRIAAGLIPELAGYDVMRREVNMAPTPASISCLKRHYGPPAMSKSRTCISCASRAWPNSRMRSPSGVRSTSPSSAPWSRQASRAVMLYLIQIGSAQRFKLARDIDPAYGQGLRRRPPRGRRSDRLSLLDLMSRHRAGATCAHGGMNSRGSRPITSIAA